jgi:hypothetical protein
MSVLCWNCRELENPWTVRDFYQMVKKKKPTLIFLMETKMMNKKVYFVKNKIEFDHMFVVDNRPVVVV